MNIHICSYYGSMCICVYSYPHIHISNKKYNLKFKFWQVQTIEVSWWLIHLIHSYDSFPQKFLLPFWNAYYTKSFKTTDLEQQIKTTETNDKAIHCKKMHPHCEIYTKRIRVHENSHHRQEAPTYLGLFSLYNSY